MQKIRCNNRKQKYFNANCESKTKFDIGVLNLTTLLHYGLGNMSKRSQISIARATACVNNFGPEKTLIGHPDEAPSPHNT